MYKHIDRLIKLSISLIVFLWDRFTKPFQSIFYKKDKPKFIILYYHSVFAEEKQSFEKQLHNLMQWAHPISLQEIGQKKSKGHYCAITFDDGFVNVMENALPVMASLNVPAAIFVPSGCLGQTPPWLSANHIDHNNRIMTEAQLLSLDQKLFLIGSHGRMHKNLLSLTQQDAIDEIFQSKRELESILKRPVDIISFPEGDFNQEHIHLVMQAGYKKAYSILPEMIRPDCDQFLLGRVKADPYDWPIEFMLKIYCAYRWLPTAIAFKKKIRQLFSFH